MMTPKKSFLIVVRIFFILFFIHFIKIAFYRWDGFAYFIPWKDLIFYFSLALIGWIISGLIIAIIFWIFTYWILQKIYISKIIHFEHIMIWFIFTVISIFIYRTFQDYILRTFLDNKLLDNNKLIIVIIFMLINILIVWIIGNRAKLEKLLQVFNIHITPLVYLFSFLLIFLISFVLFKEKSVKTSLTEDISDNEIFTTSSKNEKYPNIILVTMDTLSAMDMQVYGYHRPTTPFITKWAKNAIVFTKAYATSNWTTPTIMSIMTGQLPWTHRIWYEPHYYPVINYKNNLPQILKKNGYKIYAFVQNTLAHPEILGIGDAFLIKEKSYTFLTPYNWWTGKLAEFFSKQRIVTEMMLEDNPLFKFLNFKYSHYLAYVRLVLYSSLIRSENVYNRFLDYIAQNLEEPFFAWIHVFPPHDPYLPPKQYLGLFGDSEKYNTGEKQLAANLLYQTYEPERQHEVDILRKRYDENILYSDKQFEIFLKRLSKIVDMSNTIVILSSDHGEIFSHGYVAHNGEFLYEPLIKIPLIIKIPWKTGGDVKHTLVSQIDIAPTILDLINIPIPKWMEGRSLLPLIEGRDIEPREVFSMQLIRNPVIGNVSITKGTIAVLRGEYKLISYIEKGELLLFNLKNDPYEQHNIADQRPEIVKQLKQLIDEKLAIVNNRI